MRALSDIEQIFTRRVAETPDDPWLLFGDQTFTWKESLRSGYGYGRALVARGVRPGDRVVIMMANRPEFLWCYLGCLSIGVEVVPVSVWQRGRALAHVLRDSGSVAAFIDAELRPAVEAVRGECPALAEVFEIDESGDCDGEVFGRPADAPEIDVETAAPAVGVMYTSGTTGPPKGIVAERYDSLLMPLLEAIEVRPGETMYASLPLFHANALLVSTAGSIRLGARLALAERFSASRFWDDCRRYDAVSTNALGAMMPILMKKAPRDDDADNPLRTVLSVGTPEHGWREFEQRFGVRIVEWYGMSDAPGNLLNLEGRPGSMGKPVGGVEFKIVDPSGEALPDGSVGELVFRHPQGQLTHYLGLPEATAEAYRDGWFHSGDLAVRDEDGYYYYRGRSKTSIRRRGENVSAWEVEGVLAQHPSVLECAVFGVASPLGEEEVMAVVVAQPGMTIEPEELLAWCKGRLAYYAVPRYVEQVDSLPKTGTQKVQVEKLRERGPQASTWDREAVGFEVERA